MTAAALEQLILRQEALVDALDQGDAAALEAANHHLVQALGSVGARGAWRADRALRGRLVHALRLAEAARARVLTLADRDRRRLDRLATLVGAPRAHAYSRQGYLL